MAAPDVDRPDAGGAAPWLGVGSSVDRRPEVAAGEALDGAVGGDLPKLVVLFCSPAQDLGAVAADVGDRLGDGVAVVGCTTAGELTSAGATDGGVVAVALGGTGFDVATGAGVGDPVRGLRGAAASAARCSEALPRRRHTAMVLLADGLCGDQMEVVRGAFQVVGATVPLVGACAGDDLAMERTWQLHGRTVLTNSVVAAAVTSDRPLGIGVRHGCESRGEPMLVTASRGGEVLTLDDRPALDVFLDRLDAPPEAREDPVAFAAFALTRSLGVRRRDRIELRYVAGADFSRRTLQCLAEVPQGGLAWPMEGDPAAVLTATDAACADAVAALGPSSPLGLVAFDCVARRAVLDDGMARDEAARLGEAAGGAPVGGFYTYGEIARTQGAGGLHNQTLVVLAVA